MPRFGTAATCSLCGLDQEERAALIRLGREFIKGEDPPEWLELKRAAEDELDVTLTVTETKKHYGKHLGGMAL